MILFNLSKQLIKPMFRHVKSVSAENADLVWRAHVALIGTDTCIVAQEQHSQYIMVFCGVSSKELAEFPEYFTNRFWREATAICQQANLYDKETITNYIKQICQEQVYRLDPEPLEEGKMTKVMEKLERRFLIERKPLPIDGREAFEFGFAVNSKVPKAEQTNNAPNAAEAMGNICLNLIELAMQREQDQVLEAITSVEDNIVTVDFSRR